MEDRAQVAKAQMAAAGVPGWAPWSPADADHPRLYVWVDGAGDIQRALLGGLDDDARRELAAECTSMLAGTGRPGSPAIDVSQPTAVVLVSSNGSGHGLVSRSMHRPLGELLDLALAELTSPDRGRSGDVDPSPGPDR